MSFFEGGFNKLKDLAGLGKKTVPVPTFIGAAADRPEPVKSSDATQPDTKVISPQRTALKDGGFTEPKNDAIFHEYDKYGRPTHITANIALADIRPRTSEAPIATPMNSEPPAQAVEIDQSKIITTEAPKVTVPDGTLVTSKSAVGEQPLAEGTKNIDQNFVDRLFANPEQITTPKDLLETLGQIREYSFGLKQSKEDKSKMVELKGEQVYSKLKDILDILERNDLSEVMNLRKDMGIQIGQDSDAKSAAINSYLKMNGVTNKPPIRDIATRILTEKFSVPST